MNSKFPVILALRIVVIVETKVGNAFKIGIDHAKHLNLLTLDIFRFDFYACSRHRPPGHENTVHIQVMSSALGPG